jgi:hypothetical protein
VAVARRDDDKDGQPWHNRTPEVLGASFLALIVVGLLILAATAVARQFGETEQAPIDFVAPTYSATDSRSADATTTQTITSTSPPQTTDIDGPSGSSSSSTSSSSSSSSSSSTTSSSPTSTEQTTARTEEDEDDQPTTRTSRQRPRTNVTRTFNPYP